MAGSRITTSSSRPSSRRSAPAGSGRRPAQPVEASTPLSRSGLVSLPVARRLARIGLITVGDLLFHLPRRYDDFRTPLALRRLVEEAIEEALQGRYPAAAGRTEAEQSAWLKQAADWVAERMRRTWLHREG